MPQPGAEKIKGGLLLDTRDGVLKGGNTGPAVVPGNPDKSLLITAVRYKDKDLQMPPSDKKLPDNVIADLEQWVRMGAPDPRTEARHRQGDVCRGHGEGEEALGLQAGARNPPSRRVEDPQHWAQNDIDRFILAGLQSKALAPSPKADKVTLIRRATFDLHGLPPTEKEVDDFVADESPTPSPTVIDRLLASPRYGERWGRYWLDLAKYADTQRPAEPGARQSLSLVATLIATGSSARSTRICPTTSSSCARSPADKLELDRQTRPGRDGLSHAGQSFRQQRQ